ncbi:hypothetical protein Fot_15440 [Forsythia ovata]|uniref:Uncharacterized protein n=1 Tax=Forsythia ovata TaxID=205694 RepID=A0ABD1W956_9LAMI
MDVSLDEEYESISVINIVTDLNDSFENPPMLDEKFEEYLNFDSDDNYDYASIVDEYPSVEMLRAWYKEFKLQRKMNNAIVHTVLTSALEHSLYYKQPIPHGGAMAISTSTSSQALD